MNTRTSNRLTVAVVLLAVFSVGFLSLFYPQILLDNVPALQDANQDTASSTPSASTVITAADVIVGSLLTLFLGWVYLRQNRILDSQSDILKAAHRPLVQATSEPEPVDEHPLNDEFPNDTPPGGEWIELTLTNTGNDVATNLQLECFLVVEGEYDGTFLRSGNDLLSTSGSPQTSAGTSSIRPDGEEHTFFASTKVIERPPDLDCLERVQAVLDSKGLGEWDGHKSPTPLGNLLQDLTKDSGVDQVAFGFVVTYQTALSSSTNSDRETLYLQPAKRLNAEDPLSKPSLIAAWEQGDQYWIERIRDQLDE
ncbi:hypothetical protein [Halorubellus litoreus]|uniref:Uncharacterized protein n=1 Tax=Halorubellus litoreus TaxID=755308 RepID=A0ABD5VNX1_9EURY